MNKRLDVIVKKKTLPYDRMREPEGGMRKNPRQFGLSAL